MTIEVQRKVTIYTNKKCTSCRLLKLLLQKFKIEYVEMDMTMSEAIKELHKNGVHNTSVPILQIGKDFYPNIDVDENMVGILKFHKLIKNI